ncbi:MAG: sensor histidine kinase [Polyangiaceae bacterium]
MTSLKPSPRISLHAWMIIAVALVAAVASWDAQRESKAALSDFGREQAAVARTAADALAAKADTSANGRALVANDLFDAIPGVVRSTSSVPLLSIEGSGSWVSPKGPIPRPLDLTPPTTDAWTTISRAEAASLGLHERTAVAGIAKVMVGGQAWQIAIVTSAEHERDRERRAQARLVLSVLVAAGLVLAFGGLALRNQRKELELSRELAIADVQRGLDERLVRADKLATMGAMAIGVAHEISTPLGVIVGRSEQLLPRLEDERSKRNVQVVIEQCDRIGRVIRGLLSLARGDSPLLERIEPETVALKAAELVAHRFVSAGVTLETEVADDLPRIACEPRLLEQALANILLNARDACQQGTGHVELRVEANADRVAFVVEDDGKGIAPESIARVLEPFFTTKAAGEGTGLGLSIANEIVRHTRGTLTLGPRTTTEGRRAGTRACIEIPAVPRQV